MKGISLHAPLFVYSVRLKGASELRTFTSPHGDAKVRQFMENYRALLLRFYDSINAS